MPQKTSTTIISEEEKNTDSKRLNTQPMVPSFLNAKSSTPSSEPFELGGTGNFPDTASQRKPLNYSQLAGRDPVGRRAHINTFHRRRGGVVQQGDDRNRPCTVTVSRKCKQAWPPKTLAQVWLRSLQGLLWTWHLTATTLLLARKCLITFEYKGSCFATKEIILKCGIRGSFSCLILFFLLNPMNVSQDRWC